jgi:hypothetical protein
MNFYDRFAASVAPFSLQNYDFVDNVVEPPAPAATYKPFIELAFEVAGIHMPADVSDALNAIGHSGVEESQAAPYKAIGNVQRGSDHNTGKSQGEEKIALEQKLEHRQLKQQQLEQRLEQVRHEHQELEHLRLQLQQLEQQLEQLRLQRQQLEQLRLQQQQLEQQLEQQRLERQQQLEELRLEVQRRLRQQLLKQKLRIDPPSLKE